MADRDLPEPDRFPGAPHPRERTELFGHDEAEKSFLDAIAAGRLHHAWLIGGPEGIGKATLAYRVARFLLAHGLRPAASLDVDANHPVSRRVAAQSHPDLAVIRRGLRADGKAYSAEIRVDDVRRALDLFGATAGEGGYRVCIVDAADDLNASSANALLKLVEEPPPRSIFLIVSHAPQRLLPTVRSRCRRLLLRPLDEKDLGLVVRSLGPPWAEAEPAALKEAVALGSGSVRRTLEMLDSDLRSVVAETRATLSALPRLDMSRVLALAESLAQRGAEERFRLVLDTAFAWVSARVHQSAALGPARLAPLAEVCEKAARAAREVEVFNLDKRPLVIALFGDLADAVRRAG